MDLMDYFRKIFWGKWPIWLLIIVFFVVDMLTKSENLHSGTLIGFILLGGMSIQMYHDLKKESQKNRDLIEKTNQLKEKFIELKEKFVLLKDNIKYQNRFLDDLVTELKDNEYLREDMIMDIKEKIKANSEELKYCTLKDFEDLDLKKTTHFDI